MLDACLVLIPASREETRLRQQQRRGIEQNRQQAWRCWLRLAAKNKAGKITVITSGFI